MAKTPLKKLSLRYKIALCVMFVAGIIYLTVSLMHYFNLSPAQKMITRQQNQAQLLIKANWITNNLVIRNLGASNSSGLKLSLVTIIYGRIGQPNLDEAKFEQKIKDKTRVSKVLYQAENWEQQHSQKENMSELNRLKHAVKLAEACKTYARTNPANLNHSGLVKLNNQIQNDKTLGSSPPDNNIRLISARLLAEYEHYQNFKDYQRWNQKSKDLQIELSSVLDSKWQNWLKDQTAELNNYEYLLSSLSTLTR